MKKPLLFILFISTLPLQAQQTEIQYLSGTGSDNTVAWDFFCTKGRNSGRWTRIDVPSNWELQGFGTYNYGHDQPLADEQGLYKHRFKVPAAWKNKQVNLVFEGSMTDTRVTVNGRQAGEIHQGGFYRFKYDISRLLKFGGSNLLEVTVSKKSANNSVNQAEREADYWVFGGIYRPVYLEAFPGHHIERVAVDAGGNGDFLMEVFTRGASSNAAVSGEIFSLDGKWLGAVPAVSIDPARQKSVLTASFPGASSWNPEHPHLYEAVISLKEGTEVVHQVRQRFGFRTVEVRERDGIYVNGQKIMFRGVCRHSSWPTSGRALNKDLSILDVNLMKDMSMNAVRMSHYNPDPHFLDVCDSLGLFVADEIAGWQYPPYDTEVGRKIVMETVTRDVNHPCVVLWDNGNEGGFNPELRNEFARYDPQQRKVIEPWATLNGMNTHHYIPYNYGVGECFNGTDIFFPTEFLHGLYDGGHGAGLDDYWNLMLSDPLSAGGFLWVFADEGIVRRDRNDSIDCDGNHAPDGIVGPYREKEGSFYTIRDVWSPVQFEKKHINAAFDGTLTILNRFLYTNLQECTFTGELTVYGPAFPGMEVKTTPIGIEVDNLHPGEKGQLRMHLPAGWQQYDVIRITALDPYGRKINTWTWNISPPARMAAKILTPSGAAPQIREEGQRVMVQSGSTIYAFDKNSGMLAGVSQGDNKLSFAEGPVFAGFLPSFKKLTYGRETDRVTLEVLYDSIPECSVKWTVLPGGWLQLDYSYQPEGTADFWGISFNFPEEQVTGATLLANGPYRVWKNRMRGQTFGLYEKKYNNTVTGETWEYPEFKGYYANFYAVEIKTKELPVFLVSATENLFLHLFTPQAPRHQAGHVTPPFPDGDISVLHAIPAIGTKFSGPESSGPQGARNMVYPNPDTAPLSGRIYFRFGK
jgi:hypothetical protein